MTARSPRPFLLALAATLPLSAAAAQAPFDSALVFESTPITAPAYFRFVDVFGRGETQLRGQSVFMPITAVALDPLDPVRFYYQGGATSFAGTWRGDIGLLAEIELNLWGPWSQLPADSIAVGDIHIVSLAGAALEVFDRAGNIPGQTLAVPASIDVAIQGDLVYLVGDPTAGPSDLVELDLQAGTTRVVGTYPGLLSVAASPLGLELAIGTSTGDVQRIDLATGAVTGTVAAQLQPVTMVSYTRFGTVVYSDGLSVWSEAAGSTAIFTSTSTILDLDVARAAAATVTPFGSGCGAAGSAAWVAAAAPTIGDAGFGLGIEGAPASTPAVFVAGSNRTNWNAAGQPLPFDLGAVGAPGCLLLVDPEATGLQLTDAAGSATQPVPIPADPTLVGQEFAAQWFVPDAGIGPFGVSSSEAVAFVIG